MDRLLAVKHALSNSNKNNFGDKEKATAKLSLLPLVLKATSLALADFPRLNASLDPTGENVIYKVAHSEIFS
jgi:pyruvate/2-oxoglutarate dehydrogenase complex dihydrolipoamide acyltransferase (E2) component